MITPVLSPGNNQSVPGWRVDRQRSSSYDQNLRLRNCSDRFFDCLTVKSLLIENHIRLHNTAALTSRHSFTVLHIIKIIEFPTSHTMIAVYASMKLQHLMTARHLMKIINILRDHSLKPARLLKLCQLKMCAFGFAVSQSILSR